MNFMNLRNFLAPAILAMAGISACPVAAQEEFLTLDERLVSEVAAAQTLGARLREYDQAAWHATDALAEKVDLTKIEGARGYVVLPRPDDAMLDTVFVVERDGILREFARFTTDQGKVVGGGLHEGDLPALSAMGERMMKARGPALDAMQAEEYSLCSRSSPNTLTLPPDENDRITFFLLTSTLDTKVYPLGGHFRADIRPDGIVEGTRRYMNTCYNMEVQVPPGPDGNVGRPGISYLFGDTPSEIHVFASYHFPNGLFVITSSNDKLWLVQDGKISLAQDDFKME